VSGAFTLPKTPFEMDKQYYIGVLVDSTNAVAESDETNNANTG